MGVNYYKNLNYYVSVIGVNICGLEDTLLFPLVMLMLMKYKNILKNKRSIIRKMISRYLNFSVYAFNPLCKR